MPGAICWLHTPLTNSSIEQWRTVVIVTGYTVFVTLWYDVVFTFANQRFGDVCWHNMHNILNALSLLVVLQCVTVMNLNYERSQGRKSEQNTALNAKTEQFITAKISGNALKQGTRTHSVPRRQRSSPMPIYKGTYQKSGVKHTQHCKTSMSHRIAVKQRRYAAGGRPELAVWHFLNHTRTENAHEVPAPDLDGGGLGPRRDGRPHVRIQNA